MRFTIVGVGQTFNLETQQMEDMLQVQAPNGNLLSVPTTNEAAQQLVQMAMNGGRPPRLDISMSAHVAEPTRSTDDLMPQELPQDDAFPEGAQLFGEAAPLAPAVRAPVPQTRQAPVGTYSRITDRSGVPSIGLARVDERGNPILPPALAMGFSDEEEDPGEQV